MNEISSHLCLTNLVNKGFIMLPKGFFFLREVLELCRTLKMSATSPF